jgi:hypothetical protein
LLVYKFSSEESPQIGDSKKGQHICMNIDLGDKRGGTRVLTFLTNENPKEVA